MKTIFKLNPKMTTIKAFFIFITLLILFLFTFAILFPMDDNYNKHYVFENVKYKNETEGLEEYMVLFSNISHTGTVTKMKEPAINLNEKYFYSHRCFERCSLPDHPMSCRPSREYTQSFFIVGITEEEHTLITYNRYRYIDENNSLGTIILPVSKNFSNRKIVEDIFKNSSNCENFVCPWFLYIIENFTFGYMLNVTYNLEEIKDKIFFDEHIWRGMGLEDVNGRNCFRIEILKRTFSGIGEEGQFFPFIYSNRTVIFKYRISKEIFWIDAEKRILVKMQLLENNTVIREVNLINRVVAN